LVFYEKIHERCKYKNQKY